MRITIGIKIFGIAVGLLILMTVVALLSMRMSEKVDNQHYEAVLGKLLTAAETDNKAQSSELLTELDNLRDDFDRKVDAARTEMRRLAGAAIGATRAYQRHAVVIGLILVVIAGLLGLTVAAAVTMGLVRPVRRLLEGTLPLLAQKNTLLSPAAPHSINLPALPHFVPSCLTSPA